MASKRGVTVDNNFIGGLITQATGLNFPENACIAEDNCIFNERGFVSRRPSFDFENSFETEDIVRNNGAITTYLWNNASDDGAVNLVVMQVGNTLYFYKSDDSEGLSSVLVVDTVDITDFSPVGGADPKNTECQFASGFGRLFVVHPQLDPFAVSYDSATDAISSEIINIKIRDFEGVVDETATVETRPNVLTDKHKYNLLNQGWDTTKITAFEVAVTDYPSNADIWWLFKNASDVFDPATTVANNKAGNAKAINGHFILDAFNQDRSAVSGIAGLDVVDSDLARPSAVAFYAGRVFYAGVDATGYAGKIYFTQIIETDTQFGKCYQEADPTAEEVSALVPSDGGVIRIPGAGKIFKLANLGNYLLVFASRGVWMLAGSQGVGFAANDYTRSFLSAVSSISATSFVDIQGYPSFWNIDGIFVVKPSEQGNLEVTSVTDQKIKDFYLSIPVVAKRNARGFYNTFTHVVQWLYRSTSASTVDDSYEFDKILNYNVLSGAFYNWSVDISNVKLHSVIVANTGGSSIIETFDVINNALNNVIDIATDQVVTFGLGLSSTIHTTTKYLVSYDIAGTDKFTWAECANFRGNYLDWVTYDGLGVDYSSYFITGYKVHSEGQRRFQANYLYVFSNNDEETQYRFQSLWDFANDPESGRWSTTQIINHPLNFSDYIRRKIKVRGHGVAVQFKFSSLTGQPFDLVGWSTLESASAHG